MSSIYCQYNQWKFNEVLGGIDAKRVAINHLISSNPQDTQWEMYSYPKAATSGLCWKPWMRSICLQHLDLKIKDFIQPWNLEPSSKCLGLASVLMWQVGWSLALCVYLGSQRGCVIAFMSLLFHCLCPCSQCEEPPADLPNHQNCAAAMSPFMQRGAFPLLSPGQRDSRDTFVPLQSFVLSVPGLHL